MKPEHLCRDGGSFVDPKVFPISQNVVFRGTLDERGSWAGDRVVSGLVMKVLVVTNMYPSAERPHWGAFVRSQVESLELLGVSSEVYEIEGWHRTWNYSRALRELPAIARRARTDLVHAHFGLSGAAAIRIRDQPLVVSFCGDDLLGRPNTRGRITSKSRVLVRLSHVVARRADAVIVKSEEMRRRIPGLERIDVIPNGVDLERFAPLAGDEARARLGWSAAGHVLLFVGQPDEPRKELAVRT